MPQKQQFLTLQCDEDTLTYDFHQSFELVFGKTRNCRPLGSALRLSSGMDEFEVMIRANIGKRGRIDREKEQKVLFIN
ncbi:hypothetical protein CH373_17925 [Leptospira perolatii]|uniref:Uncharacterized protein n=1 Tax=Leptospira perolatii TaxID=2023191 RepID=A0A2M9ZI56_9LEPT|nr:hypothetical protein CH360_17870 [Leptospira perolatii]PJZ71747.1 hypothetical protein CH373_17925 [Leptospira perolatii]